MEGGCIRFEFKTQPASGTTANCAMVPGAGVACSGADTPDWRLDMTSNRPQHVLIAVGSVIAQTGASPPATAYRIYINGVEVDSSTSVAYNQVGAISTFRAGQVREPDTQSTYTCGCLTPHTLTPPHP